MTNGPVGTGSVRGPALILAWVVGGVLVCRWALVVVQYVLYSQLPAPSSGSYGLEESSAALDSAEQSLTVTIVLTVIYVILAIAGLVTTIVWTAAAHSNASVSAPGSQRFPRGLAAASAVIPFATLALLPMAVADLWRASRPGASPTPRRVVPIVAAWTSCWVASIVVFLGGNVLRVSASIDRTSVASVGDANVATLVQDTLGALLWTAGLVLFTRTVLRISAWQGERAVAPAGPGIPPPGTQLA